MCDAKSLPGETSCPGATSLAATFRSRGNQSAMISHCILCMTKPGFDPAIYQQKALAVTDIPLVPLLLVAIFDTGKVYSQGYRICVV